VAAVGAGIAWTTIALYASAAAAAAGTGFGIYSSIQQAQDAEKIAKATQRQKEIEAQVAHDNAMFEAGQARRRAVLAKGRQLSIFGAAGLDPSGGSPLLMDVDLTQQMEMDALNIERGGRITGDMLQYEGKIAKYRASLAKGVVPYEIASAVTAGAGSIAGSYLSYTAGQRTRVPRKSTFGNMTTPSSTYDYGPDVRRSF